MIAASKSVPDTALYFDSWAQGPSRLRLSKTDPFSNKNIIMLTVGAFLVTSVARRTHQAFKRKFEEKFQKREASQLSSCPRIDTALNVVAALFKSVDKSAFSLPVIMNSFDIRTIVLVGVMGGTTNMIAEYATLSDSALFKGNAYPALRQSVLFMSSFISSALNALLYAESVNGFGVHMGWSDKSLIQKWTAGEHLGSILAITNFVLAVSLFSSTFRANMNLISTRFFDIGTNIKLDWLGKKGEEIVSSIYKGTTSTSSLFALLNTIFRAIQCPPQAALAISGAISFMTVSFNILAQHALLSSDQKTPAQNKEPLLSTVYSGEATKRPAAPTNTEEHAPARHMITVES